MSSKEELAQRLQDEHTDLLRQLKELGVDPETGEPTGEFEHGFADSGQVTAEKSNLLSVAESLMDNLTEVKAAQARMEAGTYGACESCGSEILEARLEARPQASLCMPCKQKAI